MTAYSIPAGDQIRIAFLGCGQITRKHSKTLESLGLGVRRFYASRDQAKAEQYQKELKGDGSFASYEAAIASPDIDVVFVVTPPAHHLALSLAALANSKHVIVEKPPYLRAADFDQIAEGQQKAGLQVMVAENYFYKPMAGKLREILARGDIGDILFIHINATKLQQTGDWRDSPELTGGGALFEGGIHWINFLANLGLEPQAIHAMQPAKKTKLERSMMVAMRYGEGAVATLHYSWEVPTLLKGLHLSQILGRKGAITFESNGLFILLRGKRTRLWGPDFSDISGNKAMFRDFVQALRSGKEPAFNLAKAKRDVTLIEEAYRTCKLPE